MSVIALMAVIFAWALSKSEQIGLECYIRSAGEVPNLVDKMSEAITNIKLEEQGNTTPVQSFR